MSSEIENEVLTELKYVARPLMELGLYDSAREFIIDITREFIKHKIELYKKQLDTFEKKCGMLKLFQINWKMAHQSQKDEWMDWEAAENMLKAARETGINAKNG